MLWEASRCTAGGPEGSEGVYVKRVLLTAVMTVLTACGAADAVLSDLGDEQTVSQTGISWEQFRAGVLVTETGGFLVDGDTPISSEKLLREFYDLNVAEGQLIVNRVGNADDKWNDTRKLALTYCVSSNFGSRKAQVVQAMADAAAAWEAAANVNFDYLSAQDSNCTASNNNVLFNVSLVNAGGQYLAAAFFPSDSRSYRQLSIDSSIFSGVSLVGVLRHELGHVLGFRHEHTRPEAGSCFEDNQWRSLTAYDSGSVMHYPQCNGTNSFSVMNLTALDKQGVAALYGAPGGTTTPPTGDTTTETFSASVAQSASRTYGPFAVKAGTTFAATLSGSGDADLYVRFGAAPTASSYNCRPYLNGSAESCELTVPTGQTQAFVLVNGYTASTFSLNVTYTANATTPPANPGTPRTATASGNVSRSQLVQISPIDVLPGTALTVTMTGSGDPDLYVRFAGAPTLTTFDCRPYVSGASETCSLTVPATANKVYLAVNGYTAGSYALTVNYVAP